jgi:hypothetical protein
MMMTKMGTTMMSRTTNNVDKQHDGNTGVFARLFWFSFYVKTDGPNQKNADKHGWKKLHDIPYTLENCMEGDDINHYIINGRDFEKCMDISMLKALWKKNCWRLLLKFVSSDLPIRLHYPTMACPFTGRRGGKNSMRAKRVCSLSHTTDEKREGWRSKCLSATVAMKAVLLLTMFVVMF